MPSSSISPCNNGLLPTVAVTILALLAAAGLTLAGQGVPVAVAHLAFAVGVVPLILAAMGHFVPVLTRTGDLPRSIRSLPAAAQLAGLLAVLAMEGLVPRWLLHLAATADFLLAAAMLSWIAGRVRSCLGSPHPGWRWYGAALGCLMLAMAVVPPLASMPAFYANLRAFHLHMNVLGLVGLAALGTLPVLLPTALGKPDPEAAGWLRRRLWFVAGGAMTVAIGATFFWPVAVAGAASLLIITLSLAAQWWRRFGPALLLGDGVAASLLAAVAGLVVLIMAGVVHGAGLIPARPAIAAWGAGFLLPLITGALSQLLPVWRWPGPVTPARTLMRDRLAASGRWRGLFFFLAGIAVAAGQEAVAGGLTAAALVLFVIGLIQAVRVPASAR